MQQKKNPSPTSAFRSLMIKNLPRESGVYLMKNQEDEILYIGKAKNLKTRVHQYFHAHDTRAMIPHLLEQVAKIDTIIVSSEKEALLLENNLIKKHQPKYNVLLKDDKSFFSLMINPKDEWPMIRVVRFKNKPSSSGLFFGPFTYARKAREMLELMRQLFPLRSCSDSELKKRTRPCVLYDIKRCIAPCKNLCTKNEYDEVVKESIDFLRGKSKKVLSELKKKRDACIKDLQFEQAQSLHETILSLEQTLEKQQVEKLGFGNYDVLGLAQKENLTLIIELTIREGKLLGSKDHLFTQTAEDPEKILTSFLLQKQESSSEFFPILLPFPSEDQKLLQEIIQRKISVPKKGSQKKLIDLAKLNAQILLEKSSKDLRETEAILLELEEVCTLNNFPQKIECFDNSNLGQKDSVSAKVVFFGTQTRKEEYRKYKLKSIDDISAMKEVLERRLLSDDPLPDLILLDGGKAQLNAAISVIKKLRLSGIDLIALSKEQARHDKGLANEKIYLPSQALPLLLSPKSSVLLFLQRIRDEAHRFSLSYQKQVRNKFIHSHLETLPGIGPTKAKRLLKHFGSIEQIKKASKEELLQIPGITTKDCDTLSKL